MPSLLGTPRLTTLDPACIAEAVHLARSVGWNDTEEDWRVLFACATVLGHRDDVGRLVSTGALCDFGDVVTLAKMVVHESARRRGLASELVLEALALRGDADAVAALVATEMGQPVYDRIGFRAVGGIANMTGRIRGARPSPSVTRAAALDAGDLADVLALDRATMGCDRARALVARLATAHALAVARDDAGSVIGFGLASAQRDVVFVGPVLASDDATALEVVHALLHRESRSVRVNIPTAQAGMIAALRVAGLEVTSERVEMTLAGIAPPGDRARRFALFSQAYG